MANKRFPKNFGDFKGLDLKSSNLSRAANYALDTLNCEITTGSDLNKRQGSKVIANDQPCLGLYSYRDSEILMIGADLIHRAGVEATAGYLYKLKEAFFTITRVAGTADCSWSFLYDTASAKFRFVLNQGGTPVTLAGNPYYEVDPTFSITPAQTLESLRAAIDATANFSCVFAGFPSGSVNGNQVGVGSFAAPLVVNAGHSIAANTWVELTDRRGGGVYKVQRYVTNVTGNNISWAITTDPHSTLINVNNGDLLGISRYWAGILPENTGEAFPTAIAIFFNYWERVPWSPQYTTFSPFDPLGFNISGSSYWFLQTGPISSVELQKSIYFSEGDNPSGSHTVFKFGTTTGGLVQYHKSLMKYDGMDLYQHSMSVGLVNTVGASAPGAAVVNNGVVKYQITHRYTDHQGIIVEGLPMNVMTYTNGTGVTQDILVTTYSPGLGDIGAFNLRGALVNGNQAGVVTITVVADHSLRIGHKAYFLDRITGEYVVRNITGVTRTTIVIDGTAVNVNNNDYISNNFRTSVWRTKNLGNVFYLVAEFPTSWNVPLQGFVDTISDANLGPQYLERADRYSNHTFPPMRYLASHQGLLVGTNAEEVDPEAVIVSGVIGYQSTQTLQQESTVYFSEPDNVEYYAAATNSFTVPEEGGASTGIISENNDSLCTFKESNYFNIVGSLSEFNFSIIEKTRGDLGCASHNSLQKVALVNDEDTPASSFIMGLGGTGFFTVQNGEISKIPGFLLDSVFLNKPADGPTTLRLPHAVSLNDRFNERYLCAIPCFPDDTVYGGGFPGIVNTNSKLYVFDYDNFAWLNWGETESINHVGGMARTGRDVFFYSRGGDRKEFLFKVRDRIIPSDRKYDYIDHNLPILQRFRPQWLGAEEPSLDKEWLKLKVYCFNTALKVPFTLTVKTFTNYKDPDTATPDSNFTLAFPTSTVIEMISKLRSNKARVMLFEFSNNTIYEAALITGYEYVVTDPYRLEDVKK